MPTIDGTSTTAQAAPQEIDDYDEERFGHFKWLRSDTRGPTYNSYSQYSHLPACAFDWGCGGYAGSSNYGGELLYLSAPSQKRGLIMARGNFSTSLYASLSRTQVKFGGPTTFGLEVNRAEEVYDPELTTNPGGTNVPEGIKRSSNSYHSEKGSSFKLGDMIERGCFNYRWPVNEYYLDLHEKHREAPQEKSAKDGKKEERAGFIQDMDKDQHVGTCQMFSFAMGEMFYQILRIEEGGHIREFDQTSTTSTSSRDFPAQSQVVLTMGGPLWLRSFDADDRLYDHNLAQREQGDRCEVEDVSVHHRATPGNIETTLRLWDKKRGIGLEVRVYQYQPGANGDKQYKQLELTTSDSPADSGTREAQKKTNLKAYTAVVKLQDSTNFHSGSRSASFLAAIRFFETPSPENSQVPNSLDWPSLPNPKDIYKYIGVSPMSSNATGAMWDTIFLERFKNSESVFDLDEVNMIGRSLEKILQVDLISASFISGKIETALVSNLFLRPNIDLKAFFWKTRFLVRTHKFLSRLREQHRDVDQEQRSIPTDGTRTWTGEEGLRLPLQQGGGDEMPEALTAHSIPADGTRTWTGEEGLHLPLPNGGVDKMSGALTDQMTRIQETVEKIIQYLISALLDPSSDTPMMPDSHLPGESNYYYVMTTIWYVVRNFPGWNRNWKGLIKDWNGKGHLFKSDRLPPDNWTFEPSDKDKISLLQWYHYGSILGLSEHGILPESWKDKGLHDKVSRLEKAAKISAAAKLSSRLPYSADDEIIDRLSFLSDELGFEPRGYGRTGTVASLARERIQQRDYTRHLNPGWSLDRSEGSTSGPWEIHALCHHSRLVLSSMQIKASLDTRTTKRIKKEIESFKQKMYWFRNAEGTLIPCWERAHAEARKGWLRSEATAVLASTLLMMNEKDMKDRHTTTSSKGAQEENGPLKKLIANQEKLLNETVEMESLMKDETSLLEKFTGQSSLSVPIQWTIFSPPRRYHPESFFNSLEDTPELYQAPKIREVSIPVSLRNSMTPPEELTTLFNFEYLFGFLENFCIFDIAATGPDRDSEGYTWEVVTHKFDPEELKGFSDVNNLVELEVQIVEKLKMVLKQKNELQKFLKQEDDLEELKKQREDKLGKLSEKEVQLLNQKKKEAEKVAKRLGSLGKLSEERGKVIKLRKQRDDLCWGLYDSLVDQEVQHRFLLVDPVTTDAQPASNMVPTPLLSSGLLDLLVYAIHRESAACLGNHVLKFSRFACQRGQQNWVASITLRSWLMGKKGPEPPEKPTQSSKDDEPIYLPKNLKKVWEKAKNIDKKLSFELDVSSIVMSTNAFGDFSQSTIVSKLLRNDEMEEVTKDARKLWQKFIHQPQTARCLVFFLVLSKMCQHITRNYKEAIRELTFILELNNSFNRTEQEWSNNRDSPLEFELGLWSLDSLHKLQYSLKSSVNSLLEAKQELMAQIRDGPGKRSEKLDTMCQEYLLQFESSLVELAAENVKLERRIDLNTRYEESFSAVLAMRDSRASLSQEATIQRLTYLTIAYLPISLMAAIFAIPSDHTLFFTRMPRGSFGIGISALSVATYLLALYIGTILKFFKYYFPRPGRFTRVKKDSMINNSTQSPGSAPNTPTRTGSNEAQDNSTGLEKEEHSKAPSTVLEKMGGTDVLETAVDDGRLSTSQDPSNPSVLERGQGRGPIPPLDGQHLTFL